MRYFIGFLITIGLIILILVLLLRGSGKPQPKPLDLTAHTYDGSTAQLIIDGPIVADQNHNEIQIDVTQNQVSLDLYQGYQQTPVNSKTYVNNASAYAVFLHALQHVGFTDGNNDKALSDERGYCPGGDRYIFSFMDSSGNNLMRYWSTSCAGAPHTYKGVTSTTLWLFQQQVPDYNDLTDKANLID
ncbi:MAG TPA: hypothetical protein VF261_02435 [Candidatus Saccharimonadales bacterium]